MKKEAGMDYWVLPNDNHPDSRMSHALNLGWRVCRYIGYNYNGIASNVELRKKKEVSDVSC